MISAVILAAGKSNRMQGLKQLAEIEGRPMVEHVIRAIEKSNVDEIVLVLGYKKDEIIKKVSTERLKTVTNPRFEEGMSTSIKAGLDELDEKADAFLIILADQPLLVSDIVDELINKYENSKASIVAPTYKGKRGNPVLFDICWKERLMELDGDVGGRVVLREYEDEVRTVEVDNPAIILDVDNENDLKAIKGLEGE